MRCGIIGLGVIGRVHAEVLSENGMDVIALCDIDAARAERIRDEFFPKARIYTDYKVMASELCLDVIHVCTPHDLHAEMVIHLLRIGVNVLCEKPLCINERELCAVLLAEKSSKAILGVCHQNRYNPSTLFAREYLEGKKILAAHGSVVWHRDRKYFEQSPWRASATRSGGGALINQALHTLDLCQLIAGEPRTVTARAENLMHREYIEVEDTVTAVFGDGADITFFTTTASAVDLPVEINLKLDGGDKLTLMTRRVLLNGETVFTEEKRKVFGKECYGSSHEMLIKDFYGCVEGGRHFPIDAEEAAKVLRLIFAAYKSNGERVDI